MAFLRPLYGMARRVSSKSEARTRFGPFFEGGALENRRRSMYDIYWKTFEEV
jgi:hypothetical protein